MDSKKVIILFLSVSAAIAGSISERGSATACDKRWALTEEEIKNFVYDPENEEAGPHFEGDIVGGIPEDFYNRQGIIGDKYRWPNNTLVYSIDDAFTDEQKGYIKEAHRQITNATDGCIQFREKTDDDEAYAAIEKPENACNSPIGYRGKRQVINLSDGCFKGNQWGTLAHEHIHALGFNHEQTRDDRDDYVTIVWMNIKDGEEHNFCKRSSNTYNETYDYNSIMHYNAYEFSMSKKLGLRTIIPLKTGGSNIGQRERLSDTDARRIKKMYGCA